MQSAWNFRHLEPTWKRAKRKPSMEVEGLRRVSHRRRRISRRRSGAVPSLPVETIY